MEHQTRRIRGHAPQAGPVERVDPFDHPQESLAHLTPSLTELADMRLGELRSRISELDVEVAGLLAQREALTRAAFEMARGARVAWPDPSVS